MPGRPPAARIVRATTPAPHVEIVARIADHRRFAGRARRSVNAGKLISRHGQKAERVVGPQISLGGEGKADEIRKAAEIVGMNALRIEFGPDRRDALVSTAQSGRQPTRLQRRDLVAGRGLDRIEQALVRRFAHPHYDGPTPSGAQGPVDPGMSPPSSTRVRTILPSSHRRGRRSSSARRFRLANECGAIGRENSEASR